MISSLQDKITAQNTRVAIDKRIAFCAAKSLALNLA
jgi:hypothetical protein